MTGDRVVSMHWAASAAFAASALSLVLLVCNWSATPSAAPDTRLPQAVLSLPPPLELRLSAVLRTWRPDERAALIADSGSMAREYRPWVVALLTRPEHRLFPAALEVVCAHPVDGAAAALRELVVSAPAAALPGIVRAVEALGGWSDDELAGLLRHPQEAAVLAALGVLATRRSEVAVHGVDLLGNQSPALRGAAADALRTALPQHELGAVVAFAREANGSSLEAALRVFGRGDVTAEAERMLARSLSHTDPAVRRAALDSLAAKGAPLRDPESVWRVAVDIGAGEAEQARAFLTLERTRTRIAEPLRGAVFGLRPVARYYGARYMVAQGDIEGLRLLLDPLELDGAQFGGVDPGAVESCKFTARELFARLTGSSVFAAEFDWRTWLAGLDGFGPHEMILPAVGLD